MMRKHFSVLVSLTVLIFCLGAGLTAGSARADEPQITNAKLETRRVGESLSATVLRLADESEMPLWIGYSVEKVAGPQSICCGAQRDNDSGSYAFCRIEAERNYWSGTHQKDGKVNLESDGSLVVLLRIDKKQLMRIRLASSDCTLDASALRFVRLTGVKPGESVAFLTNYVHAQEFSDHEDQGISGQALAAIAMHADPSADRAFASFVAPEQPNKLRKEASFWLGAARGKVGLLLLQNMAKNDPSADVREQVVFALYVSPESTAVDDIIRMAHDDRDARVRGQALFWLAQKAGAKAAGRITGAIESDPDTEVKKKAVFALSHMPADEGVPKLIQVAQSNRNPEIRKQAMFWLGQSNDPRALQFFEKVLSQ